MCTYRILESYLCLIMNQGKKLTINLDIFVYLNQYYILLSNHCLKKNYNKKTPPQIATVFWVSMVIKISHFRSFITILAHSFSSWNSLTNNSSFRMIGAMNRLAIDWRQSQVEVLVLTACGVCTLENWTL